MIAFLSINISCYPLAKAWGREKKLRTQLTIEKLGEYIKKEIFFNKENSLRSPVALPNALLPCEVPPKPSKRSESIDKRVPPAHEKLVDKRDSKK